MRESKIGKNNNKKNDHFKDYNLTIKNYQNFFSKNIYFLTIDIFWLLVFTNCKSISS